MKESNEKEKGEKKVPSASNRAKFSISVQRKKEKVCAKEGEEEL